MSTMEVCRVEPWQVFNLSLFDSYIVVDCREEEEFFKGRIVSSLSFPSSSQINIETGAVLNSFCDCLAEFGPENFSPIVLVHNPNTADFASSLASSMKSYFERPLLANGNASEHEDSRHGRTLENLRDKCKALWLLDFHAFFNEFPFLCDPSLSFSTLSPTPRVLAADMLACTRGCVVPKYLEAFRITHVLSHEDESLLTATKALNITLVSYNIPDKVVGDFSDFWSAVSQCVKEIRARERGQARFLLRLHGKTITSTTAAACLVAVWGWPLDSAIAHCCTAFSLTHMWGEDALRAWASREGMGKPLIQGHGDEGGAV